MMESTSMSHFATRELAVCRPTEIWRSGDKKRKKGIVSALLYKGDKAKFYFAFLK
jgi:hypothetical protein